MVRVIGVSFQKRGVREEGVDCNYPLDRFINSAIQILYNWGQAHKVKSIRDQL